MPALSVPPSRTLAILLAGGQGTRLHELTAAECKPAVHFAGAGRIVDFTMANAVRAGLSRMLVATQYRPFTLSRYLPEVWGGAFPEGGLMLRDGYEVAGDAGYRGTADAVTANIPAIDAEAPDEVIVLAGDHIYDMDYAAMIADHRRSGALATVAVDTVPLRAARAFGVVHAGADGQIIAFQEKPQRPAAMPGKPTQALVSMGIYVFSWPWLRAMLLRDQADAGSSHDFGKDILPAAVLAREAHAFRPASTYWRDVGTLDAYRQAQLDFAGDAAPCTLPDGALPPGQPTAAAWARATMNDLLLRSPRLPFAAAATQITGSVLLPGARAMPGVRLTDTVVAPRTVLPTGLVVGEDRDEDARWFRVTDGGTTLVTTAMLARRLSERMRLSPVAALSGARGTFNERMA